MNKQTLRQLIRERKRQHTAEALGGFSQSITRSLLERIENEDGIRTILLYHSLPDEVNTHNLIRTLYAQGKTIILPTVSGEDLTLHIYEGESSLATGTSYGIQESTGPLFTDYASIDLALIPGMAFTLMGDRLGRGKGHYDHLLPRLSCPFIGLAFPFQIVPHIPTEKHDIRMTDVVTV
jgi:5-formyltetrahydrofolate cyclo-ligase